MILMGTDKAGTIAGSTYPLDLVRSRLSIATASVDFAAARAMNVVPTSVSGRKTSVVGQATLASGFHTSSAQTAEAVASATSGAIKPKYSPKDLTMWGMTLKVMREEGGVRALYRGLITTAVGVAPYVGINFAAYEALRGYITPPGKTSVGRKLSCGALAGGCESWIANKG